MPQLAFDCLIIGFDCLITQADAYHNMAVVHEANGQYNQALALAKLCLDIRIKVSVGGRE